MKKKKNKSIKYKYRKYGFEFKAVKREKADKYVRDIYNRQKAKFREGFNAERRSAYQSTDKRGNSYGPAFDERFKSAYDWYLTKVKRYQAAGNNLRASAAKAALASLPDELRFKYIMYEALAEYPESLKQLKTYLKADGDKYDVESLIPRTSYMGSQDLYRIKTTGNHDIFVSFVPSPQDVEVTSPQIDKIIEEKNK